MDNLLTLLKNCILGLVLYWGVLAAGSPDPYSEGMLIIKVLGFSALVYITIHILFPEKPI